MSVLTGALLAVSLTVQAQQQRTEPAAKPSFDILEYQVEGNTVLDAESIERAIYPFLGEQRGIDDVEAARTNLEKVYRDAGFGTVVVDVPEQKVADGVVVLKVTEAQIARLRVVGARYYSQGRILDKVPGLAEGQVPNFPVVQGQLASVNRGADRRVTPLLRPGKEPGTTEVDLQVEDQLPLHGSLQLDNRASANTSEARLTTAVRYDNLWQREHSIGLQLQMSPQNTKEVQVLSGSYTVPQDNNDLLVLSATRSNSRVPAGVAGTTVFGRGSIYSLRDIVLLKGDAQLSHTLALGADYKHFNDDVRVEDAGGFSTPISYVPLSLRYDATMDDPSGQWQAGGGLTWGLRTGGKGDAEFANKRYQARSNFAIAKLDLARTQNLPKGFAGFGKLDAQLSDQPLISNEQFVAGGVDSVRGYLEAAAVGDQALRGSLELRSPNLAGEGWPVIGGLRTHWFADGAYLRTLQPLPGQTGRVGLLSTGVGLRLQASHKSSLSLDLAWPLRRSGNTERGDLRLHGSASIEFN